MPSALAGGGGGVALTRWGGAGRGDSYFGTYEAMKENLGKWLPPQSQVLCPSLAAVSGNAVSSLIFVPKEVLKQRCQVRLRPRSRHARARPPSLVYRSE